MKLKGEFKIGAVLTLLVTIMSIVSVFWIPFGYNDMDSQRRFLPPLSIQGGLHLLGTDNFGRDVFSRIMAGARYTLLLALGTVASAAVAGGALGLLSGYHGGLPDECVMRLMDALSSFPGLLAALVMTALLGNSQFTLFIALLVLFIPSYTRVMRSGALQYRNADFILAEGLLGAGPLRVIFIHLVPNFAPSLLSASVLGLSNAILAESAMSYLGLGIQPPLPGWGRMLAESQGFLFNAPWCALAPGAFIALAVIAFHCLGEGLRRNAGV